ncbi:class I SAM-dependent methyltransferase [Natrialba swarupiae]|nr:class I SAM-dependent methyltransferase [Natrialba swarupiae]
MNASNSDVVSGVDAVGRPQSNAFASRPRITDDGRRGRRANATGRRSRHLRPDRDPLRVYARVRLAEVEAFVGEHTDHSADGVGLDLGCGNCRHAELLADAGLESVLGVDVSRGLLETGRDRATDRGSTSPSVRPTRRRSRWPPTPSLSASTSRRFITSRLERRVASLDELARVLAPGARALVSAWSTAHDRFDETDGFDTTVEWTLPGGTTVDRFYHIYAPEEFERDLLESNLEIREWELSSGNCYATVAGSSE